MRNKVVKKLLMIAMAVTMISGTSLATVYANANPPAEETTTAVVEETITEKSKDTEKAEDTGRVTGESNNSAFSTPGNAQLVDDKENDDTKQFLTMLVCRNMNGSRWRIRYSTFMTVFRKR